MSEPDILYHYCSNSAFHSIIENKTIRLSSLSLGNDYMEGKLVPKIIIEMAKEDATEDKLLYDGIQESISELKKDIDCFGFCLSEKGDLLSQWRGYADNASGVSIGFSKSYFFQLSNTHMDVTKPLLSLKKVVYDPRDQKQLLKNVYQTIESHAFTDSPCRFCNADKLRSDIQHQGSL